VGPDGVSRSIGAKTTNQQVLDTTLKHGDIWSGDLSISNRDFLAIYLPLKNINNEVVGMLSVAQPMTAFLQTTQAAIRLTYLVAIICLLALMLPIYLVSRQIARQLK
jgi:sensor histidine kinase regulating citrate/malate metabolism